MSAGGPPALPFAKPSDGPVALLLNRRLSAPISALLARWGVTPNAATLLALLAGVLAAAAYGARWWWVGGLALQLSSVLAGVDGELARRSGRVSRYGDFLDTVSDRLVEYLALAAIAYGLAQLPRWEAWAWPLGVFALGGTFVLAAASEKYRSVMQEGYPKRQLEPLFAYLVSGRDVRVFYLALASLAASWRIDVLPWTLAAIALLAHLNFFYRVWAVRGRIGG